MIPPPPPKKKKIPVPLKKRGKIHIQEDLISGLETEKESAYTSKILAPIYEPKNRKPDIFELVDQSKAKKLVEKIQASGVSDAEKKFLIAAAQRHNVFTYKLIADYYAHSGAEMQDLMEQSALVIIDFGKAIQNGYIKFSEEIKGLYVNEYEQSK